MGAETAGCEGGADGGCRARPVSIARAARTDPGRSRGCVRRS